MQGEREGGRDGGGEGGRGKERNGSRRGHGLVLAQNRACLRRTERPAALFGQPSPQA